MPHIMPPSSWSVVPGNQIGMQLLHHGPRHRGKGRTTLITLMQHMWYAPVTRFMIPKGSAATCGRGLTVPVNIRKIPSRTAFRQCESHGEEGHQSDCFRCKGEFAIQLGARNWQYTCPLRDQSHPSRHGSLAYLVMFPQFLILPQHVNPSPGEPS